MRHNTRPLLIARYFHIVTYRLRLIVNNKQKNRQNGNRYRKFYRNIFTNFPGLLNGTREGGLRIILSVHG